MDFATNLKRICTERGTTPTTVLKNMGKSTSKVNLWNNGSFPVSPHEENPNFLFFVKHCFGFIVIISEGV